MLNNLKIEINELSSFSRELVIHVPWEELSGDFEKTIGKFRKKAKLPGFRPGKVPKQVLMNQFLPAIEADFVEESFRKFYVQALKEKELIPVNQADVNDLEFKYGKNLSFKAQFEVEPKISIPPIKKLKLTVKKHNYISDNEDVELAIEDIRKAKAKVITVEDGAKSGDFVLGDLQKIDESGIPIIGGKIEKRYIQIGEGAITGENQSRLEGIKANDKVRIELPDEKENDSLVEVSVINIERQILPEINDEFVKDVDPNIESEAAWREKIQDEINYSYSRRSKEVFERQLSDALIEKIDLECPPSMVDSYLDHILEDIREKNQGVEIDEEKLKKNYTPVAERNLKWYLVRKAIIQEHNLEVNKSEIDESINQIIEKTSQKKEAEKFYKKPSNRSRIEDDLMEQKIMEVIQEHTKVKEVDVKTADLRAQEKMEVNTHE